MFFFKLEGGTEVVGIEAESVFIEVIDYGNQFWFIEAVVSEQLTDMGPILLFHVGIIIFLIGAGAGKLDGGMWSVGKVSE